jgi:hypothetical protein
MTLLLLLGLLASWVLLDLSLCFYIFKAVKSRWLSVPLVILIFPIVFVFPVSDELIAKRKFDELCAKEDAAFKPVIVNAENRDLLQVRNTPTGFITNDPLQIDFTESIYLDLATGEELLKYKVYSVQGGRLIRFLGVSNSNSPLTIGHSSCAPKNADALKRSFRLIRRN